VFVNFVNGNAGLDFKFHDHYVRAVRSSL